jgi:hypothetical protein
MSETPSPVWARQVLDRNYGQEELRMVAEVTMRDLFTAMANENLLMPYFRLHATFQMKELPNGGVELLWRVEDISSEKPSEY